ncbi:hypothetical protein MKW92_004535 [Papaver armeniacum]|nr:hypothetical protein MKW92_004535 [Papaver armeniacum]
MVEEDGGGDWVKEAMEDEFMVAELLTRLKMKKHDDSGSSPSSSAGMKTMTSLEWGIRQPRSRQVMIRCSGGSNNTNNQNQNQTTSTATAVQIKKEGGGGESTRASPTTPLSWSTGGCGSGGGGGGGVSICGGDGYEDSSKLIRQRPTSAASLRSIKVNGTSEPNNRRARKKKTFAELKEEESLMLKERFHLKKELATLRRSWEEEKARNNQLKRIKMQIDLQHISANQRVTKVISQEVIYSQSCNNGGIDQTLMLPICNNGGIDQTLMLPMVLIGDRHDVGMSVVPPATLTLSNNEPKENEARQSLFDLPDLNEPFGEDSGPEVLYGMS